MPRRHLTTIPADSRPHPTHVGYCASLDGRVFNTIRSRKRFGTFHCPEGVGYELKGKVHTDGHIRVTLAGGIKRFVHVLVLETFVGPCPDGMQCLHRDGNPANNRLDNLRWGTPLENWEDSVRHGTTYLSIGEHSPYCKLSDADVAAIRDAARRGTPYAALAASYGVNQSTISRIVLGLRRRRPTDAIPVVGK